MQMRNPSIHGTVPEKARVALLLIDVINDLDFPEGDQLLEHGLPMARQIHALKVRARQERIPAIYANDNFGRWQSNFNAQVKHCLEDGVRGQPMVELLVPDADDYFLLKPRHSGFYSTALDILLRHLGVTTVILTGVAANICVLFTANDAYMRDLRLFVPCDCVASNTQELNCAALEQMQNVLKANITHSETLDLAELHRGH